MRAAPAPLDAAEMVRGVLYELVRRSDAQAVEHRRAGAYALAVECEDEAEAAQAEIEALYLE